MQEELVDRLVREFGLGDGPTSRLRFYQKLANLGQRSPLALAVIREVAGAAKTKRCPGRWFCRTTSLRLHELGLSKVETEGDRVVAGIVGRVFSEVS